MTFEDLVPEPAGDPYVPKVFGFRVHSSSGSLPQIRMSITQSKCSVYVCIIDIHIIDIHINNTLINIITLK